MESGSVLLIEDNKKNSSVRNYSHEHFGRHSLSETFASEEVELSDFLNWTDIQKEEEVALLNLTEDKKKKQGIFFTPLELVTLSVDKLGPINSSESYFDPACGTGNLLVEVAKSFEANTDLEKTLTSWNLKLYGLDIEHGFIDITKKKLIRLAIDKGSKPSSTASLETLMSLLSNIKIGNFIDEYKNYYGHINNVIMNPPFSPSDAPKDIVWSSGRLNAASLFLYYATEILSINGKLVGIFPDVLRAGSRYTKLRSYLTGALSYSSELYGEFQKNVQVDVFILQGKKQASNTSIEDNAAINEEKQTTLQDYFGVSVGPVVPHRDKKIGTNAPYIHAKSLPPWGEILAIPERITHQGRKIKSPFVAIRRTSSPKDKNRAIATLVNCKEAVAVENHIIIAMPKNGDVEWCRKLLKQLATNQVNEYINSKIRCRHLTVDVIKGIPLEKEFNDK